MDTHANTEQRHGRPSESDETDPLPIHFSPQLAPNVASACAVCL